MSTGTHTISFKVQDNLGRWSTAATSQLVVNDQLPANAEKIYVFRILSWDYLFLKEMSSMLTKIGATSDSTGTVWQYKYAPTGKNYVIYYLDTKDALKNALMEPGAHIVTGGHSNYGTGPCFTLASEGSSKKITAVNYANDDRFLLICSDIMTTDPEGMVYDQAFPNWKPIYTDGTSAQAPSDFSGSKLPPYNYYLTYTLPGDSTLYRVQLPDGSYVQRYPDSSLPVWYSSSGAKPDPVLNPEYFMVYPFADWNKCSFVGGAWSVNTIADDNTYDGYNYAYRPAGTGTRKAVYNLVVLMPGQYEARATWRAQSDNASNAEYTITHALGTTVVHADQRTTKSYGSNKWNSLGTYTFNRGSYTIQVSDKANGRVIADAVELYPLSNPANVVQAEFRVDTQSGSVPLTVNFTDSSLQMAGSKSWLWTFGDGSTSTSQNPAHTYTKSGVYSVSLKVTDAKGNTSTETKPSFIVAGSSTAPVTANFTAATGRTGTGLAVVYFKDQSVGNVTSWNWDFGDGSTSTLRNPTHVYYLGGSFNVTLTVSAAGTTNTETEPNYVYVTATPVFCDNAMLYKPAQVRTSMSPTSGQKIAIDQSAYRMHPEDMKYSRLYWATCNSANYFLDTFKHGIVFCTTTSVENYTAVQYLQNYMQGLSDQDNLTKLNQIANVHAMVDFSKKPPSMQ